VDLFGAIHSVDSLPLAQRLDRLAGEAGRRPEIYLQVNSGGEESKGGFSEQQLRDHHGEILKLKNLRLMGLMCIPPPTADPEDARDSFRRLRLLRDELQERGEIALPGLSMGMSHDFEVAIEEGSTIVRVGSAIFGTREIRPDSVPVNERHD
jgi:pyridoxal phosphate enzyme (YggS family)